MQQLSSISTAALLVLVTAPAWGQASLDSTALPVADDLSANELGAIAIAENRSASPWQRSLEQGNQEKLSPDAPLGAIAAPERNGPQWSMGEVHPGIRGEIPPTPALRAAIARVKERGGFSVSKSFYKGDLGGSLRIEHSPPTVRYAPMGGDEGKRVELQSQNARDRFSQSRKETASADLSFAVPESRLHGNDEVTSRPQRHRPLPSVAPSEVLHNPAVLPLTAETDPALAPNSSPILPQTSPEALQAQVPNTEAGDPSSESADADAKPNPGDAVDLKPEIVEDSPVLQRWLREVPNVLSDIRSDPAFRTRLRLGYTLFTSTEDANGLSLGVEDIFLGRTGLTLSGEYHTSFDGRRELLGGDLRYYVLPLGSYVNVAGVAGYRSLRSRSYSTEGPNLGARLMLALSRGGAADLSLTQTWVSPGNRDEVGLTTVSLGYAVTRRLRISTDWQKQNSRAHKDSRLGIGMEWMF